MLKAALEAFIEEFRLEATLDEVVAKARCSKCLEKNMAEGRIVFVEGSEEAMPNTATKQASLPSD